MESGASGRISSGRAATATVRVTPIQPAVWMVLAATALGLSAAAVAAGPWYTVQVRLVGHHRLPATTVLAAMAAAGLVSALVGRRREWLGLLGLASVSFGAAVAWLLLSDHRFAGPVILPVVNDHGFHLSDLLALAPMVVGLGLLIRMLQVLSATWRRAAQASSQASRRAKTTSTERRKTNPIAS